MALATEPTLRHIAIIMDGNGRWAKSRGLPRTVGHYRGAESVRKVIDRAIDHDIAYLTLFAFSSENWKRPMDEVRDLMGLLRFYLDREVRLLADRNVRLNFIGDRSRLSKDMCDLLVRSTERTAHCTGMVLTIAISYGGRAEIAEAARQMAAEVASGTLSIDQIDEDAITAHLQTNTLPDPDLVIRTSGEQRISNFMLWQLAYAEMIFLPVLWPDFDAAAFDAAIDEYKRRERRYGAVSPA
ncbi:isoprenyl transferase [Tistrella bauzanensis]|uniref:Isoprenyl transferase n=1 Tax=Tistrella bauzanensis TaxID=657419 RepID=A0ABQ1IAS4_9PROT|nr:isoprenyl transferase [Tistrella bauzanensis]GGB30486.1 isoprenyl transferase [Tistrella bauzanensis]